MSDRVRSSAHEPKLAALAQFHAGRLSERGRQRVLRHLQRCERCSEALAGLRRFEKLAADLPAAELPALDWTRIERETLRVASTRLQPRRLAVPTVSGLLIAAAAMLVLGVRMHLLEPFAAPLPVHTTRAPEPLALTVTALVGEVHALLPDGQRVPLTLDSRPQPGWTIETAVGAEAHLWLADTAQVLVRSDSALELASLQRDAVELDVERGSAISKVRPLGERHYEVDAGGYRATVRGTHFEVTANSMGAAVRVYEGHVVVLSANGVRVADLLAGQTWTSAPELATSPSSGHGALAIARGPDAAASATLIIPVLPSVVAWQIGSDTLGALGELRTRAPIGELDLSAELGDGRLVPAHVVIDPLGTRFDPALLRLPSAPRQVVLGHAAQGQLDTTGAAAIIRSAQPALQRCYERSLRTSDLAGIVKLTLRLSLDASGKVRNSELSAATAMPPELAACLRDTTRALVFPAPGGNGITFEAPLSFHSR